MSRKPKFKHTHIVRLRRFLDMLYTPAEIAAELGVSVDTVYRSYLPAGLPHSRDDNGRIWIHGLTFAAWARETIARAAPQRQPLPPGHAWCLRCNQAVEIRSPRQVGTNRYVDMLQGTCPRCGARVNRIISRSLEQA